MFTREELEHPAVKKKDLVNIYVYIFGERPKRKTKEQLVDDILKYYEVPEPKVQRSARVKRIYGE